jgi:DNA-binding NarL/FixJ family response regulator
VTHAVEGSELRQIQHTDQAISDTGTARIRVVVVDEHPLVRWALMQIAADQPDLHVVGDAANATDAINQAFAFKPDVVTVDCSQPNGGGWQLTSDLRKRYPDLGIVILTSSSSDEELFRALESGASAFVSKSSPIPEIMSAVRHAAVASSTFSAAGLGPALRRRRESVDRMKLSPRELQILLLLHDGMSVPKIAELLFVSLSTAKTYVARLYEKLGARNRAQALMSAVRLGMFEGYSPSDLTVAGTQVMIRGRRASDRKVS